jgi:hypothetical protein
MMSSVTRATDRKSHPPPGKEREHLELSQIYNITFGLVTPFHRVHSESVRNP